MALDTDCFLHKWQVWFTVIRTVSTVSCAPFPWATSGSAPSSLLVLVFPKRSSGCPNKVATGSYGLVGSLHPVGRFHFLSQAHGEASAWYHWIMGHVMEGNPGLTHFHLKGKGVV